MEVVVPAALPAVGTDCTMRSTVLRAGGQSASTQPSAPAAPACLAPGAAAAGLGSQGSPARAAAAVA